MAKILVIEDDDQVRSWLCQILSREAHDVVEASNRKQGARIFREQPAELVITDLIMPEKEGIETIVELVRTYPSVKIIAISGGGVGDAEAYLQGARILGAQRVLKKPFSREELLKAVSELTGRPQS
ncbi:MAG: response regulator [Acidobacteriota bacterium]